MVNRWLQFTFFFFLIRPVILIILGLNIRHKERLPECGPAVLVSNHNSHLDTLVLMTLFPSNMLRRLRPVAAKDYFCRNRLIAWFALKIMGIIPFERLALSAHQDPLAPCSAALEQQDILILFPEGSRGEPEQVGQFKSGIAHLAKRHQDIPIYPIFLHGLGKALPKGEAILVPFFCDVFIGEALYWKGDRKQFMADLEISMNRLSEEGRHPSWE